MTRWQLEHLVRAATGWCLEIHDLLISKLVVGREKDLEFAREARRHHLISEGTLRERLLETHLSPAVRKVAERRLARLFLPPVET